MNFTYESIGSNTYLVYEIQENDVLDSLSLGMLTNNKIPGLTETLFMQMDAAKFIKYNVSAKVSVKQFFTGAVNKKRLIGVLSGIVDGLLSAEDYMIDINTIILDLDYIFVDVSTCAAVLICLPVSNTGMQQKDLGIFFKNIMANTQFDSTENIEYVAKIFNFLNGSPVFSVADFKCVIDEIKNAKSNVGALPTQNQAKPAARSASQPRTEMQNVPPLRPETIMRPQKNVVVTNVPPQPVQAKPAPMRQPPQTNNASKTNVGAAEKKIGLFDLLMHYNAENVELYKRQKAMKKDSPEVREIKPPVQKQSVSFAVPGMQNTDIKPPVTAEKARNVQPSAAQYKAPAAFKDNVKANMPSQPAGRPVMQATIPQPNVQPAPQGYSMNFGETTVLDNNAIGETTVLDNDAQQVRRITPYLLRSKNNEKIEINKPVFRIGKEKSYVDYFISDNTAVSRSHANIVVRNKKYFLVDTNSTNHTYINGKMIQSNVETEITHGDKVRLGNEDFEFRLY